MTCPPTIYRRGNALRIAGLWSSRVGHPSHRAMMTSSNGKHFPRYWPFVRGINRSLVNSPHKGQLRGASMFSLICAWINGWVNISWGWWFETLSRSLWRHRNANETDDICFVLTQTNCCRWFNTPWHSCDRTVTTKMKHEGRVCTLTSIYSCYRCGVRYHPELRVHHPISRWRHHPAGRSWR